MKMLSICIPTYNREGYLKPFLEKIFSEIEAHDLAAQVEVLVSDNASADNTESVCQPFVARGLIYSRNTENIGPDANFLKLFQLAQGEHLWLPGDDDSFADGLIPFILDSARKESFDYLYLKTTGRVAEAGQRRYSRMNNVDLLARATIFTTFMTSQVIRAALIKSHVEASRRFLGGYMAYYFVFAKALELSQVCLVSEQKEIFVKVENTGGYNFYRVWGCAVLDSLSATAFGNNRKVMFRFKMDLFVLLILSITYNLRQRPSGYNFSDASGAGDIGKYFGSRFFQTIFGVYKNAPLTVVGGVHLCARIVNKVRRQFSSAIC